MGAEGKIYEFSMPSEKHDGSRVAFCWRASYETSAYSSSAKSEMTLTYDIEATETKECPVSLITPESRQAVEWFAQAERVKDMTGAFPGGMDPNKWDARWFDYARIWRTEFIRIENGRAEAEKRVS